MAEALTIIHVLLAGQVNAREQMQQSAYPLLPA